MNQNIAYDAIWEQYGVNTKHVVYNTTYNVTFSVNRTLSAGESLFVLGSIPELGTWKQPVYPMTLTTDNLWVSKMPLVTRENSFNYKYAVFKNNGTELIAWETGVDRIADLVIMPDHRKYKYNHNSDLLDDLYEIQQHLLELKVGNAPSQKHVRYYDVWESYMVNFQILMPVDDPQQVITFNSTRAGANKLVMRRVPKELDWMWVKYGKNVFPYQCSLQVENKNGSNCGQFKNQEDQVFRYSYIKTNDYRNEIFVEREPYRCLTIRDPSLYRGQLGDLRNAIWPDVDHCWIVNGVVYQADANFINNFFVKKIHDTGIFIGSYPSTESDVSRLRDQGVNSVLNIMDSSDFIQRGISFERFNVLYASRGINNAINSQVTDQELNEYCITLFQASQVLNNMVNYKKQQVFLHDMTGVSRAPTLLMVYLALYMKSQYWNNLDELLKFVKQFHPIANPNMEVVKKVIADNKDFIEQQRRQWEEDERLRKSQMDEMERLQKLKDLEDENERQKYLLLIDQETEKLRLQRIAFQEAERQRQKKWQDEIDDRERRRKQAQEQFELELQRIRDLERERVAKRQQMEKQIRDDAEKIRLKQEQDINDAKLRLQKLQIEYENLRLRYQKENEDFEEQARLRLLRIQKEEADRIRREKDEIDEYERYISKKTHEYEEWEKLKRLEISELEAELMRVERAVVDEENYLRLRIRAEEEEMEREKLKKEAELEAQQLLQRLKMIEEEEAERIRKKRLAEFEFQIQADKLRKLAFEEQQGVYRKRYSHIYLSNQFYDNIKIPTNQDIEITSNFENINQLGITENELDQQCDELFRDTPIIFEPRKDDAIDLFISEKITQLGVNFPIVWISDNLYLIGCQRIACEIKNDQLMVRIGGGYEKFDDYIAKKSKYFQRMLVIYMIKSGDSLEYVVDQLINERKITNVHLDYLNEGKFKKSSSSNYLSPRVSGRNTFSTYSTGRRSSFTRGSSRIQQFLNANRDQSSLTNVLSPFNKSNK